MATDSAAFITAAGKARNWLITANQLRIAGDHLWSAYRTQMRRVGGAKGRTDSCGVVIKRLRRPVHFGIPCMLYGLALENALKALRATQIVAQGDAVIVCSLKGERLHPALRHHNLEALAQQGGLSLSGADRNLLRRLEKFAVWAGRYPMPVAPPPDTRQWRDAWRNAAIGETELQHLPRFWDRIVQAIGAARTSILNPAVKGYHPDHEGCPRRQFVSASE
jgi:hypothetical protein